MTLESYLSLNPKKYLIFDLDGTIAKLNMDWNGYRRTFWNMIASFDKPLSIEIAFAPKTSFRLGNEAIRRHGKKAKQIINDFVEKWETTHLPGYTPNPDLINFIKTQKQYEYFLWSNQSRKAIEDLLVKEGLKECFKLILTRDNLTYVKPDPQGFDLIFKTGTNKKDYLLIGDLWADRQAAKAAGIDFFLEKYFKKV